MALPAPLRPLSSAADGAAPGGALRLQHLRLTQWRSFAALALEVDDRPVVLAGANGAGKTNILEAISTLGPGRGMRGAELGELGHRPAGQGQESGADWAVAAFGCDGAGEAFRVGVGLERDSGTARRVARIDGRAATPGEIAERLRMVWALPAMDRLFAGPAGDRRKFFDRLTMGFYPGHGPIAAVYERALRERQRVLDEDGDPLWLDALESRLAESGAALAAARVDALARLQAGLDARASAFFPQADLAVAGELEAGFQSGAPAGEVEDRFKARLRAERGRDRAAGRALSGPHRADWPCFHRAAARPAGECSTGEQKALLLSILLAYARALSDHCGALPLMLIDEAGAHLDSRRRDALCGEILDLGVQAWLTGTDLDLFSGFGARAQAFWAEAGQIRPASLAAGASARPWPVVSGPKQ